MPEWAKAENPSLKRVHEGEFDSAVISELNESGYNIYYYPNNPSIYTEGTNVDGSMIDTFEYVFVDMDLKDGKYTKESFLEKVTQSDLVPSRIVDSGNGMHVYWKVSDLNPMSFLTIQRRLTRYFHTDEAVSKILQLMRYPGTVNTKHKEAFVVCEEIYRGEVIYTCEELDKLLPPLTQSDLEYCQSHYNKTYNLAQEVDIDDVIPLKFAKLIQSNAEVKSIWSGSTDDRSKSDYRLGHLMFAAGFTKDEAMSVLVNGAKALERAPKHRVNYAKNIADKIWAFEKEDNDLLLSQSVKDILAKNGSALKGTRFPCWRYFDATAYGLRLGQVIGLVAGSGVGKTAIALNMFEGFVKNNPDYVHFFIPLEQPAKEIADRWSKLCGENTSLHEKVHVMSNYDDQGAFRHLSLDDIKDYLLKFQDKTGKKIGCVVIDHIGALKKKGKNGENQDLMDICHAMKAFAVQTNTLLVMQSQSSREKAGIGDLELDKDAAYGTVYFESYSDYLVTLWQPIKRCHKEPGCPTVTAFKFCKIRHKNQLEDKIHEDVCYRMYFDPTTERLREMTQDEGKSFAFFLNKAVNKRKQSRQADEVMTYESVRWDDGAINNDTDQSGFEPTVGIPTTKESDIS